MNKLGDEEIGMLTNAIKSNTELFKELLEKNTKDLPVFNSLKSGLERGKDMFKQEIDGNAVHIRFNNKSELSRFIKFIRPKVSMVKINAHLEGSCGSFMTCPVKSVFADMDVKEEFIAMFLTYEDWDEDKIGFANTYEQISNNEISEKDYKIIIENSVMVLGLAHLDLLLSYGQEYLNACEVNKNREAINEYTLDVSDKYIKDTIKELIA